MITLSGKRSILILFTVLWVNPVFAGGLSTSGQGTRALGMGGAFTAVADNGSAVYYNPAGMSQISGTSIEAGTVVIFPSVDYTLPNGVKEKSTKACFGPSFFATHRFSDRLAAGFGIYAPFARNAEFEDDLTNGFASQRAKMVRTDFSLVLSYNISDQLSFGGGLILGYSQIDQSIPAGPALRITDKMDGIGLGGILALLWRPSEYVKAGATFRTEMSVDHKGDRTIDANGFGTTGHAHSDIHYPASVGIGIAVIPSDKLIISVDADWYGWKAIDPITVQMDGAPPSSIPMDAHPSWDFRIGGEYKLPEHWSVRGGYAYVEDAVPVNNLIPSRPDGNGSFLSVGMGKKIGNWNVDLLYQYGITGKETTSANIFGFNGTYQCSSHTVGVTVAYRF